jgi:hypothetical protein
MKNDSDRFCCGNKIWVFHLISWVAEKLESVGPDTKWYLSVGWQEVEDASTDTVELNLWQLERHEQDPEGARSKVSKSN